MLILSAQMLFKLKQAVLVTAAFSLLSWAAQQEGETQQAEMPQGEGAEEQRTGWQIS